MISAANDELLSKRENRHDFSTVTDARLIALFKNQNPKNKWLNSHQAACSMFETSKPSFRQIIRAEYLLSKLGPKATYLQDTAGILEKKRVKQSVSEDAYHLSYCYRLQS